MKQHRRRTAIVSALTVFALPLAGCSSAAEQTASVTVAPTAPTAAVPATTAPETTVPKTPVPATTVPETPVPATTQAESVTLPQSQGYVMPADPKRASYAREHHDYPASDIFVACGALVTSPTNATVLEVRRVDAWVKATDNPATRGGKSVSLLGDDGVRYYFAHFDSIADNFNPGDHIPAGFALGEMGETGRAGACHLHFAISPPCPGEEWSVRRGVIWPWPYLDAWRSGTALSPAAEVAQWAADHPGACEDAMSDPNAADS